MSPPEEFDIASMSPAERERLAYAVARSSIPERVPMPILLYEHLRGLCLDGADKSIVLRPEACEICAAIVRWAREGREVESGGS